MNPERKIGMDLHVDDPEARRQAAATLGRARTDRKVESARKNIQAAVAARRGAGTSDAQKAAVKAYWERYRAEKAAVAAPASTVADGLETAAQRAR